MRLRILDRKSDVDNDMDRLIPIVGKSTANSGALEHHVAT
jgi:hypothetical protein